MSAREMRRTATGASLLKRSRDKARERFSKDDCRTPQPTPTHTSSLPAGPGSLYAIR